MVITSCGCFVLAALYPDDLKILLASFTVFEVCVGLYFPSIGTLRAKVIPGDVRSIIMNLYRVPLNLFVLAMFINLEAIGQEGALYIAAGSLLLATAMQLIVAKLTRTKGTTKKDD